MPGTPVGSDALVEQAWQQAYLDPQRALAIGRHIVELGAAGNAGYGWLHVALAEVRGGTLEAVDEALPRARAALQAADDRRGLGLCDEVQAIALRRRDDFAASLALQTDIDGRSGIAWTDHDRFLAHNSRAITCKLLGRVDDALRHYYSALDAARRTGWGGAVATVLANLGGYHQDQYNLDDARTLSEQALQTSRALGARATVGVAAANLIIIHHACGATDQVRAMADFLRNHPDELMPGALERFPLPLALAALDAGDLATARQALERGAVTVVGDGDALAFWSWLQARWLLASGDPAAARQRVEATLAQRERSRVHDQPYDLMQLLRAAADACEQLGDLAAALAFTRRAHAVYESLVGRSARARLVALRVGHELAAAQRERDVALQSHRVADDDRRRLSELNRALESKIAETERLHQQLREQALRDPLTGLNNRRHFFAVAPGQVELARRQNGVLCVVLLDLDHFKAVNDSFGHQAGDAVLQRFSRLLTQTLRRSDVVCRHGGEEFVALMPAVDLAGAQTTLQRLLEVCRQPYTTDEGKSLPPCTFSAGVAVFPAHGGTLDQLLTRADRALYEAKRSGRARITPARLSGFGSL